MLSSRFTITARVLQIGSIVLPVNFHSHLMSYSKYASSWFTDKNLSCIHNVTTALAASTLTRFPFSYAYFLVSHLMSHFQKYTNKFMFFLGALNGKENIIILSIKLSCSILTHIPVHFIHKIFTT